MTIAQRAYLDSLNRRRRGEPRTLAGSLQWQVREARAQRKQLVYPLTQFDRPGGIQAFAELVLGVRTAKAQQAIFEQVEQACDPDAEVKRVLVSAAVKVGKTFTIAIIALWRFACVPDSRTVLSAPREDSINRLVWGEISKLFGRSGTCLACRTAKVPCEHSSKIPGKLAIEARTGLKGIGYAEVWGTVASTVESLQGISDPTLMIITDESVAIREQFYEALYGNMVSSVTGCFLAVANPNRTGGWFHRAATVHKDTWRVLQIKATDVFDEGIPGLATRKSVRSILEDSGVDSDSYRIRVLAEFPLAAHGGLFTDSLLSDAKLRWTAKRDGFVVVGIDPASSVGTGDGTGFALRVQDSIQEIMVEYGLESDAILDIAIELANKYTQGDYTLCIDRSGLVGFELYKAAMVRRKTNPRMFLIPVNASDKSPSPAFGRMRDLLVERLRVWLKTGSLCEYPDFDEEAKAFSFGQSIRGQSVATSKQRLRQILGRSPDAFDCCALSAFPDREPQRRAITPARQPQRYDAKPRDEMSELRGRAY